MCVAVQKTLTFAPIVVTLMKADTLRICAYSGEESESPNTVMANTVMLGRSSQLIIACCCFFENFVAILSFFIEENQCNE